MTTVLLMCFNSCVQGCSSRLKYRGESEPKSLIGSMLLTPQKGQFRGECAARTRRGQGDGEAKATRHCVTRFSIHCSRSLNLALAASRPVMTGVSSSSFAKSLALANARDLLTGCSSWTRWSRTSTPEVRYKMHPT